MSRNSIIALISVNIILWLSVYFIGLGFGFTWESPPFSTETGTYAPTFVWGTLFNALIFYGNAFWLYPLKKKKKWTGSYWLLALCFLVGCSIIEASGDYFLAEIMNLITPEFLTFEGETFPTWALILGFAIRISFVHIFFFFLSFLNIFYIESSKSVKAKLALEQEKLKSELKFLKAQINPHFLFNGVNSVYHLIDQKPAIAKSTLLRFSNLLRYQLYECNDEVIPLEKELNHIRDYVEMEKIRKGEDVQIHLDLPEETHQLKIPPLLFTPFIENAFKYVSNHDDGEKNKISIKIRLQMEAGQLRFESKNTIDDYPKISGGGIGIANVKKRLALLYPKQHDLDILEEENQFIVRMRLTLEK